MSLVVTGIDRSAQPLAAQFAGLGVATVHEAQGRRGLLHSRLRPIYRPAEIVGTAVTCEVAPGDNWMIHVAAEQCRIGDVLVVAPTSPCTDGYFGDLIATALMARGVKGLIIDAGVRDVAALSAMQFPVWSTAICAQGTVKETVSTVNTSIVCAAQRIDAGDLIVADDDGVVVVRKSEADAILMMARARLAGEEKKRVRLQKGDPSLDVFDLRRNLVAKGVRFTEGDSDSRA